MEQLRCAASRALLGPGPAATQRDGGDSVWSVRLMKLSGVRLGNKQLGRGRGTLSDDVLFGSWIQMVLRNGHDAVGEGILEEEGQDSRLSGLVCVLCSNPVLLSTDLRIHSPCLPAACAS